MESLRGRVVLITGASSGIGEATARRLAAHGCHLVLGARRRERLEALRAELAAAHPGAQVHVGELDVASGSSVLAFLEGVPEPLRAVDVLVNNAGAALGRAPAYATPEADIDGMIDVNVKGALRMLRAVVPGMIERGRGDVVNIGSIAGREPYVGGSVYCASKSALNAISGSLRKELVGTPLRVISIDPGLVETEFSVVRNRGDAAAASATYRGLQPLVGDDIADAIAFAVSRPPHVQIADMMLLPTHQASAEVIHRN